MAVHFQQPRVEAERLLKLGHLKMVTQRVRYIKEKERKKIASSVLVSLCQAFSNSLCFYPFRMHMGTDGKLSFSNIRMTEQLECYLDTIIQPITIQNIDTIMTLSFLFRVYVALFR